MGYSDCRADDCIRRIHDGPGAALELIASAIMLVVVGAVARRDVNSRFAFCYVRPARTHENGKRKHSF
jgi:hypothetical protein